MTPIQTDMTGTLCLLQCETGARVSRGEVIAQIECMKVQFAIEAQADGVIEWRYNLGEVVGPADVLGYIKEI